MKEIVAGIFAYHPSSQRILLGLRTDMNCWCNFGGTFIEEDTTPQRTAVREFWEETMCEEPYTLSKTPLDTYSDNFKSYYTYLATFKKIFEPTLNDEHKDYGWFKIDNLPSNIYPNCLETIEYFKSRTTNNTMR